MMDDDESLLNSTITEHDKVPDLNDIDEDALLGDDTFANAAPIIGANNSEVLKDESFELDYDEDEEKEEKSGKFTSERSRESGSGSSNAVVATNNENAGSGGHNQNRKHQSSGHIQYPYNPRGGAQIMRGNRGGRGSFRGRTGFKNFQSGPPQKGSGGPMSAPGIQPTMVFNLVQGPLSTNPFGPGGVPLPITPSIPPLGSGPNGPGGPMVGPGGPMMGPGGPMIGPGGPMVGPGGPMVGPGGPMVGPGGPMVGPGGPMVGPGGPLVGPKIGPGGPMVGPGGPMMGPGGPMMGPGGPLMGPGGPMMGPGMVVRSIGPGCHVPQRGPIGSTGPSKSLPSLMNMDVPEPSVIPGRGQKILINPNFKPNGPPGNPTSLMVSGPPSVLMGAGSGGPRMNTLPMGMRPSGMPGAPMMSGPGMPQNMMGGGPIGMISGAPAGGQWDNAVAEFLGKTTLTTGTRKRSRSRRSSSYSSYSSYTSGSRSSSYSSRSRSRSRDKDRRRDTRNRFEGGRKRGRGERGRGTRGRGGPRRDYPDRGGDRQNNRPKDDRPKRDPKEDTIESAKALGLDSDYLKKLDEQKRQREEITRRKYGSRREEVGDASRDSGRERDTRFGDGSREKRRERPERDQRDRRDTGRDSKEIREKDADKEHKSDPMSVKKKAYLAVRVGNVKQLPTALKKVQAAAEEMGEIRKCWQSDPDVVSVIFIEHDKAKNFMIKYNTKVWSGLRIAVNLEKVYLNLAEIP